MGAKAFNANLRNASRAGVAGCARSIVRNILNSAVNTMGSVFGGRDYFLTRSTPVGAVLADISKSRMPGNLGVILN